MSRPKRMQGCGVRAKLPHSARILNVDDSERLLGRKEARMLRRWQRRSEEAYYLARSTKPNERMPGRQQSSLVSRQQKQCRGRREMLERGDER